MRGGGGSDEEAWKGVRKGADASEVWRDQTCFLIIFSENPLLFSYTLSSPKRLKDLSKPSEQIEQASQFPYDQNHYLRGLSLM